MGYGVDAAQAGRDGSGDLLRGLREVCAGRVRAARPLVLPCMPGTDYSEGTWAIAPGAGVSADEAD